MSDGLPPSRGLVLLVDDDRDIIRAAALRLQSAGFRTHAAHDAESGLAAAVAARPGAIVLDVRLPRRDGLSALAELKRRSATQQIPVIVLSASVVDQQRALDAGARFFLKKPYRGEVLVQAVQAAILQPRSTHEIVSTPYPASAQPAAHDSVHR